MPSLNLFLPALLGGFIFVNAFYVTRLWVQRKEGYSLILAASVAAGILWFGCHVLWHFIAPLPFPNQVVEFWDSVIPVKDSLGSATAFALAWPLAWLLNCFARVKRLSSQRVLQHYLDVRADPFELLMFEALAMQFAVAVTLKSGKVYVGTVFRCTKPANPLDSISLNLQRSGYRDHATHELILNLNYQEREHGKQKQRFKELYNQLIDDYIDRTSGPPTSVEDEALKIYNRVFGRIPVDYQEIPFTLVIPTREIQSARKFDLALYDEHFAKQGTGRAPSDAQEQE